MGELSNGMLTTSAYITAWSVYLVGVALGLRVFFRITQSLSVSWLRRVIRALVAGVLLAVSVSVPEQGLYAPALMSSILAGFAGQHEAMAQHLQILGVTVAVAIVLAIIYNLLSNKHKVTQN